MSDRRRERVRRAGERAPPPTGMVRATFWVTRGSDGGTLCSTVRVWVRCPERLEAGGLVYWYAQREIGVGAYWCEWTLAECERQIGTVPDDDRQCLRADGGGLWERAHTSPS